MLSYLYLPISSERPSRRCYRERIPARQERVSGQSVTPTSSIVTDRRISWHARASRANKVEKAVDQCSSDSSNSNNSFLLLPRGRHPRSRNHHAPTAGWCGHPVTSVAIRKREQFRGNSMARETAPARFRTRARKTSPEREIAVAVAGSRIIWSFAGKRGIVTEFRRVGGPSLRRIGAMINGDHAARARARARARDEKSDRSPRLNAMPDQRELDQPKIERRSRHDALVANNSKTRFNRTRFNNTRCHVPSARGRDRNGTSRTWDQWNLS